MFLGKRQFLFFGLLIISNLFSTDDFVITNTQAKKKYSTSQLKELIGQETKNLFNQTTKMGVTLADVHEHVAQLQKITLVTKTSATSVLESTSTIHSLCSKLNKELAFVQQHCSSLIESLVDDCPPFKKATKNDLNEALISLGDAKKTMTQTVNSCQLWCSGTQHVKAADNAVEKKMCALCKNLSGCVDALTSSRMAMNGKRCLKMA